MLGHVPSTSVFGRVILVTGPESLLVDRAVREHRARAAQEQPDAAVVELQASEMDRGTLGSLMGGSLISPFTEAIVSGIESTPPELVDPVVDLAKNPVPELAMILTHPGGVKGKGLLDKLKKAKIEVVDAAAIKPWDLPQFVSAEARVHGVRMDAAAAQALVGGVGNDARALASAVRQLVSDAGGESITAAFVTQYFGGRAEVTGFAVVDDVFAGDVRGAVEKLRWASETGVQGPAITGNLASQLRAMANYLAHAHLRASDYELAPLLGVAPFRVKALRSHARSWSPARVATAIQQVAAADADIKGQAGSPDFILERLIIELATPPSR